MSRSPERITYGIERVSSNCFKLLQRVSPSIPLMVRSAKIIDGRAARAFSSAAPPSATMSTFSPCRCSTKAMRRATCGSSSTMRITARPLFEADAQLLAQVRGHGARRTAGGVPRRVVPAGDPRRKCALPRHEEARKGHADRERQRVRGRAMPAVEGEEGQDAPGDEEEDVGDDGCDGGDERGRGEPVVAADEGEDFDGGGALVQVG